MQFYTDTVVPLALQGFGSVSSIIKMPFRHIMLMSQSTQNDEVKRLIREKFYGRQAEQ